MGLIEAVRTVFGKYAVFTGRARRSEFWWFALAAWIANLVALAVHRTTGSAVLLFVLPLVLVLPQLAVTVRRLHDTGRTGWWALIGLVPFSGWIALLALALPDSQPGTNRYGSLP